MRRPRCFLTAVLAATWVVSLCQAAPVDDAKALLAKKQFDQVDQVLEKELSSKTPPADALRVSLDAAIASGKPSTAAARVTALLKATDNKDADLICRGA